MNKLITKIVGAALGLTMAVGVGVAVGASRSEAVPVHAAENDTHSITGFTGEGVGTLVNNGTTPSAISVSDPGYSIKQVIIGWKHNKSNDGITASVTVGGDSLGSGKVGGSNTTSTTTIGDGTESLSGAVSITWTNGMTGTGKGTLYINTLTFVEGEAGETYTVSFNGNGGTGSMSAVTDVSGSYTLPANGFTAPSGKAFSGWKAGNAGDLIAAGASYTVSADVTFFAQWADAYTVTYTAGTNGSGSFAHTLQPAGTYTLLDFTSLTGVSANSGYRFKDYTVGGVSKDAGDTITLSAATSVTVNFEEQPLETTYDFTTNFSTYASSWSGYGEHEGLNGKTDIGGDYAATIDLYYASKQTNTINDRPVFASKTASGSYTQVLKFTLTETGYKIKAITVTFAQWTTKTPSVALYKGGTVSGTALDTATIGTKNTLSVSSLNDTVFSIGYSDGSTSSNVQSGLTSIYISLEAQAAYGTTDHIKVTGMPRTVYHIGEVYDSTGLAVTAYDGADESTANFKDVTSSITTRFTSGVYTFDDTDVPSTDMWIEYEEDGSTYSTDEDITIYVYALAEYQLVESAPADWSGNYLIVATDGDSNLVAMNGGLANPDVEGDYQVVTEKSTGIIEAGQENEWTIASYSTGYSIQGKSGKYIGRGTDSNGMDVSDSALLNTLAFADGEVTVSGSSTGRKLSFNTTGNRFRYYSSGTVKLYKLVESSEASSYADMFLETLATGDSAVCDAGGNTNLANLKQAWKDLADVYDLLSASDKEQFRTGVASDDPNATNIAKTLALYDYVAAKYNTQLQGEGFVSNYDFMSRGITPLSSSKAILGGVIGENGSTTAIIVIVSLVSLTAIGGYFFIRKRKEQ